MIREVERERERKEGGESATTMNPSNWYLVTKKKVHLQLWLSQMHHFDCSTAVAALEMCILTASVSYQLC